jgi:uncharacterized protein YkwD
MKSQPVSSLKGGIFAAFLATVALAATACAPAAWKSEGFGTAGMTDVGRSRPEVDLDQLEQRVHQLVNHERTKKGLAPLAWNPVLNKTARQHSQDMARRRYFAHNSPEGHDLAYRFSRQGFACQVKAGGAVYMGSENIYETSLYASVDYVNEIAVTYQWKDLETIAHTIVKGWMRSPTHRAGILEPSWQTQGIGVAISTDYRVYVTQDFC